MSRPVDGGSPTMPTRPTTMGRPQALSDSEGPIPVFPPRRYDNRGCFVPISEEERKARIRAAARALTALDEFPDDDPAGSDAAMMRGIDANRPPGRKLFEGMY